MFFGSNEFIKVLVMTKPIAFLLSKLSKLKQIFNKTWRKRFLNTAINHIVQSSTIQSKHMALRWQDNFFCGGVYRFHVNVHLNQFEVIFSHELIDHWSDLEVIASAGVQAGEGEPARGRLFLKTKVGSTTYLQIFSYFLLTSVLAALAARYLPS